MRKNFGWLYRISSFYEKRIDTDHWELMGFRKLQGEKKKESSTMSFCDKSERWNYW